MGYNNGKVTAPVSIYDIKKALGVSSNDVGTLCTHKNINVWARYRPIPCSQAANNKPQCITPAQRLSERYGIDPPVDMFSADDITAYENYANSLEENGLFYLKLRPWGDTHFKRITDFSKDTSINTRTGKGYDRNAQPDNVKVIINSGQSYQVGTHYLSPLIPVNQRILSIPAGSTNARFMFPVDHVWMDVYYQKIYGTTTLDVEIKQHEEWLSPIDFMGTNTYSTSYASVIRRILIFTWDTSANKWVFYNYATDKTQESSSVWNSTNRPFTTYPQAWLDLTDTASKDNTYYWNRSDDYHSMGTLTGKCLFIDCWLQSNSSTNLFPIVGYAYEVTINRTGANVDIDISGVLTFERVEAYASDSIVLVGYISYAYVTTIGLSNDVKNVINDNYDTLNILVGSQTYNVKNNNYEHYISNAGGMAMFEIVIPTSLSTFPSTATMTGTRSGSSLNPKAVPITVEG